MTPLYIGSAPIRQVFVGTAGGGLAEVQEVFVGSSRVHRAPTPLRIETLTVSPTFYVQGSGSIPARLTFNYAYSSLPSSMSVVAHRPDGTTLRTDFHTSLIALSGSFTQARPTILGVTTYTLDARDAQGAAHRSVSFETRLAASILSFTDGGFRTDPQPGGGTIYRHRLDWRLSTAVFPGLSDSRYSATLAKVSGPGTVQADALRATNKSDGRGTLNLTSGQANSGQTTVVRLTASNGVGSAVSRTLTLRW